MSFQKYGKTSQAVRCIKSIIMNEVIDSVLFIDTFEQKCVVIKGILQWPQLKYHVQTIGIEQSLRKIVYINTNVLKTSENRTSNLVSVTTRNNSKILLRMIWFLLLKDSPTTVLYIPGHNHQSRNQVLKNHCVCLLTI